MSTDPTLTISNDPFTRSLLGEYLRLLLIGTAVCSALASAFRVAVDQTALMLVIGNILVLSSLVTSRFAGTVRGSVLIAFAIAAAYITSQSKELNRWWLPFVFFSPATLVPVVVLLAVRDFAMVLHHVRWPSYRVLGIAFTLAILAIYMVAVPSVEAFLKQYRELPTSYAVEELTVLEQLRIRSAKLVIFAVFAYVGSCVASFINVVAWSAPHGESVALRSSACPKCGMAIRRLDNLPIFSYLNLAGRCRSCAAVIPVRYFLVEVIGAVIFGSLFLFELVTGAANVPGFQQYSYTGIVWIILYTKWPVVGIYVYHVALFSCLMMLTLMDVDRLRCPKSLAWFLLFVFSILAISIPTLQPVSFYAHTPFNLRGQLPQWAIRLAYCLLGGFMGWLIAFLFQRFSSRRLRRRVYGHSLPLAASLIGVSLGWQATITIALLTGIAVLIVLAACRMLTRPLRFSAAGVLLTVTLLHHPAWKWLASFW